jgi:hypothetical protein
LNDLPDAAPLNSKDVELDVNAIRVVNVKLLDANSVLIDALAVRSLRAVLNPGDRSARDQDEAEANAE